MPPLRCRTRGLRESASCASALPSARSRNRREEAAWAASAAHRTRTYRAQCPMPHQGWRSWFQPCTLRIQRTALLPQAAAGPRTKKSSAAFMQNQGPAKTARRRQLVDTGVAPQLSTSAAGLPGGLPGGHRRRTRGMTPTNDCSPLNTRPGSSGRSPRGGARAAAHASGGIDTVNMEGVNLRLG